MTMIAAIALGFAALAAAKEPDGWRETLESSMKDGCVSGETAGKSRPAEEISAIAKYCACTSAVYANTITYDELLAASKSKTWQDMPKLDNRLSVAADMKCADEIKAIESLGIKQ
jgi:hypothetical protein